MPFKPRNHKLGLEVLVDEYLAAEFYGLYLFLLLLSFLVSYCVSHSCRCTYLSEAGATLLVGFIGGGLLQLLVMEDTSDKFGEVEVRSALVSFSGSVLFCVLLPPIVFSSGYHMRGNFFWSNIDKITMLAFAGTFISTLVSGLLVFWAQSLCCASDDMMTLPEALTFGAMISAIDPVTTLAIFDELKVDPHLTSIVFGESVLNDAVSIVLFHTFAKCIGHQGSLASVVISTGFDFIFTFVGSVLVGILCGGCSALLFKHLHLRDHSRTRGPHLELCIFMVFCYVPYLLAECMFLSGTVAILFTGTCMKRYTFNNLSEEAQQFTEMMISLVAHIAESFIFIDLGTSAWQTFHASPVLVVVALAACLVARASHVYPIGSFLNSLPMHYPRRKFQKAELHMVWFAGLRGAIAYALSTQFPGPHRRKVMSLTMAIVLITVWGMGGATVPVIRWLGIRQMQPEQLKQLTLTLEPFVNRLRLVHWDRKFLRPFLTQVPAASSVAPSPSRQSGSSDPDIEGTDAVDVARVRSAHEADLPMLPDFSGSARVFNGMQASLMQFRDPGCERGSGNASTATSESDEDYEGPEEHLLHEEPRQGEAGQGDLAEEKACGAA